MITVEEQNADVLTSNGQRNPGASDVSHLPAGIFGRRLTTI